MMFLHTQADKKLFVVLREISPTVYDALVRVRYPRAAEDLCSFRSDSELILKEFSVLSTQPQFLEILVLIQMEQAMSVFSNWIIWDKL